MMPRLDARVEPVESAPAAETPNQQPEHRASGSKRDSEGQREHGDASNLIHGRELL
jgi:hypothetical protein